MRPFLLRRAAALIVASLSLPVLNAYADAPAGPAFVAVGHDFPQFSQADQAGLAVGDFDGDGREDFAFVGRIGSHSMLYIAGKRSDGTLGLEQSLSASPGNESVVRVLTLPAAAGARHLLAVTYDTVREFAGTPLAEIRSFDIGSGAVDAAIGDADGDGVLDLVVRKYDRVELRALSDGSLGWSQAIDYNGTGIALAQLDADPALEIVLGGSTPGRILDGATHALDWQYPDAFGHVVATSFTPGGPIRLVAASSRITAYATMPYTPLWDYTMGYADIGDIVADSSSGMTLLYWATSAGVFVLDPNTRSGGPLNTTVQTRRMAVVDIDGTGHPSLAYAADGHVGVLELATGSIRWQLDTSIQYTPTTLTLGSAAGSGTQIYTPFMPNSLPPIGLEVHDFQSGDLTWSSSVSDDAYKLSAARILRVDEPGTGAPLLILAGEREYPPYGSDVVVVDAVNYNVVRHITPTDTWPWLNRRITDAALADMDGDGAVDIVVSSLSINDASGTQLSAYRLDGTLIWTSTGMGNNSKATYDVLVTDPASGACDCVVVALQSSLRAYGRLSHTLEWTLESINHGAAFIAHGAAGPEFVLEHSNALTFYDATTRQLLRTLPLPDQVYAVTPLDGRIDRLLVSSEGRLRLIDGRTGAGLATSPYVGEGLGDGNQLGVFKTGVDQWDIAAANPFGLFRYRLQLTDRIFANGFD